MIRVALIVSALTSPVSAGAWEEFEQRCLEPMENVALAQPVDLQPVKNFKNDGDTYSQYVFGDGAYVLSISDGRNDQPHWCGVTEADNQSVELADLWIKSAISSQRYVNVSSDTTHAPITLQSTAWREPRIEVSVQALGISDGPWFVVRETALES